MITTLLLTTVFSTPLLAADDVAWHAGGYDAALRTASAQGRSLFIALVPDWSDYSRKMSAESLVDPAVAALLTDMVCVKYEQEDEASAEVARRYNVSSFPTLVIAGPHGEIDDVIIGYFPPAPLISELQRISSGRDTLSDHLARVAAAPDDLAVRYAYAVKLDELGDSAGYQRELATIREADPQGLTFIGNVLQQQDVWNAIAAAAPGGETTYDLAPIEAFLDTATQPDALFQGWVRVANFHAERERRAEAVNGFRKAEPHVPQNQRLAWANGVVNFIVEVDQGDLPAADGEFAIALTEELLQAGLAAGEPDADGVVANSGAEYAGFLAERHDQVARCYVKWPDAERLKRALEHLRRAIELAPENTEYRNRLALLEERR